MLLHETPRIAAGLDHLMATEPLFAGTDLSRFEWRRRDPDFGGLIRMILGQQVSVQAAAAMWAKLAVLMPQSDPALFLTLGDPQLASAGFSRQKMRYGRALAETLTTDPPFLARLGDSDDETAISTLIQLPGIGRWSAEVYLMFCLGRPDVWPVGDLGIVLGAQYLLGLPEKPKPAELIAIAEPWKPHRSAAALLTWHHYSSVAAQHRREQRGRREQREASKGSAR
ncbi:MAG: glycosylase [Rhodospirillales bacterium]|nr:glycosylase [Rhodospirillales bacterium]